MDGLIVLDKPAGISSASAVYRLRRITGQRKSGHAGTLDPAATGVLIVCLGRATRLVESLMELPKVYRATARLDVTSESFDADRPLVEVAAQAPPTGDAVRDALAAFVGTTLQTPPAISAVKIGGRPAYKLVRRGQTPALTPRPVRIDWIRTGRYEWPRLEFEMQCGRGTYVRALIRDLGQRLGTGGCLTGLRRLAVGPFDERRARTLESIERAASPPEYLIGLETARSLIAGATHPLE